MQAGRRHEPQAVVAAATHELRAPIDRSDARTAAPELRLALAVHDVALTLLRPVDDRERLDVHVLAGAGHEAVHEPRIVGRTNTTPLLQRLVERQLRRREYAGVVPQAREQRPPRVAQKCEVTPAGSSSAVPTGAGSSNHECQYLPSSS